nr:hypothetical protein Iba_chr08eCG12010 [Ipomoea batatas]
MECAIRLGLLQQRGETEKEIAQAEVDRNFKKIEEVEVEVDVEAAVTAILVAKTEDLKLKAAILKRVPVAIAEAALSFNSTERPSAEASATATLLAYFPEKSSSDEASDSKPPNFESNFCKIKFWNMEFLSLTMSFSVTPTARMSPFHSSKSTSLAAMDIFGSPEQQSFEL